MTLILRRLGRGRRSPAWVVARLGGGDAMDTGGTQPAPSRSATARLRDVSFLLRIGGHRTARWCRYPAACVGGLTWLIIRRPAGAGVPFGGHIEDSRAQRAAAAIHASVGARGLSERRPCHLRRRPPVPAAICAAAARCPCGVGIGAALPVRDTVHAWAGCWWQPCRPSGGAAGQCLPLRRRCRLHS